MKAQRLVLFDGNALIHRAFHALPPFMVRQTGEPVGAVFGFAQMLLKVISELKPTHYAIAFDKKGPTFRHKMFDRYKAHRPPTPDELVKQIHRVKQLVESFSMPIFELDYYEADDILGALSLQASRQCIDSIIVTGDADIMQLVSPQVKVLYPRPGKSFSDTVLYDEAEVSRKFGVGPEHVADFKGLVGDPSDNIPGVPGIGGKTAVKLIQQFGTVEQIYEHINEVEPPKLQEKLRQNEAVGRQSKELATIVTELPVTLNLDECRVSLYDREKVARLFRELEFTRLLVKLPGTEADQTVKGEPTIQVKAEQPQGNCSIVSSSVEMDAMLNRLSAASVLAFDTETTSLDAMSAQLVGISLSMTPGEAYYIPLGHVGWGEVQQLPLEEVINRLKPVMADAGLAKVAQNGKYDMTVLAEAGLNVENLYLDTMIAAHLLGEKSIGLKALALGRLGVEMTPISELIGSGKKQLSMSQIEIKRAGDYACADADMTLRLYELLGDELRKQGLWKLCADVEMPLVPVLMRMERNGIALDMDLLRNMAHHLGGQIVRLEGEIYNSVGHQFNINSPRQLGPILFDELQLPTSRGGKNHYSTEAAVLEELKGVHPVIEQLLEYRQLTKIKSTYVDALPVLINPKTGRIHTSFNQTRTSTGRLSSSEPNLQNIPVRGEIGKQVRQAFIAPHGSYLLAGDYSQIDLRALAHLSQDPNLVSAFQHNEDIHAATAAQLFGVDASQITSDMRRLAKTVNFGVIYGMSDYGLEQATELSREESAQFIAAYFEKYSGVRQYLEDTKEKARKDGYVETILGRRRFIPEINSSNRQVRESAERMAINMPVQGTSADIIKVAMVNLSQEMERRKMRSKMLLQVHDELVFEVIEEEMEEMSRLVPDVMSRALELGVPLKVDTKQGANWGQME